MMDKIANIENRIEQLRGPHRVAEVIRGVDFINGIAQTGKGKRKGA